MVSGPFSLKSGAIRTEDIRNRFRASPYHCRALLRQEDETD